MAVDAAGHPADLPIPPPPHYDDAHELVVDTVFPELSRDSAIIIQLPTYRDEPKPRLRGTETSQGG
jgi:hypothetical protein